MRIVVLSLLLVLGLSWDVSAQNNKHVEDDHLYLVGHRMRLNKFHTINDLEHLNKTVLKHLFMKRVELMIEILPFIALPALPGMTLEELAIPDSKKNTKMLENHYKAKKKYNEHLMETLEKYVNYADSKTIISAILELEGLIFELQVYFDGNMRHKEHY